MRMNDLNSKEGSVKQMVKWLLGAAFFTLHPSLFTSTAIAQSGMVTDIKIVAVDEFKELAGQAGGYSGSGDKELDFRKGRGGGYVFALSKNSADAADTVNYITDVVVTADRKDNYGVEYDDKGKHFLPATFYQEEKKHKDALYRGGLNGRDYSIYGGAYTGQEHVYISHTGCTDFNNRVLKAVKVTSSRPTSLERDQEQSGPHAGGGRYFVFTWHTHNSVYNKTGDVNTHEHFCDLDQCKLFKVEKHNFEKRYGVDKWCQLPETNPLRLERHYKQCKDCGQVVYETHKFATYTSDWTQHNKRCLDCDMVEPAGHVNFGKNKIPVDEYSHMLYCDSCGFLQKVAHDYSYKRSEKSKDCERTLVEYTCSQCFYQSILEEPGLGHIYNTYGICDRDGCLHPYQQPEVEKSADGKDSVFVVKTFGNLYWISDYVNNRRPKTNIRLDNDLIADKFIARPWRPIGATDSTAFKGTFNGGGHVISMLQTEEPVAGCGYRGLFGAIGQGGKVENVAIAACEIRGWNNVGAIAGVNDGDIKDCHVVFSIMSTIGSGMNLGGICGLNRGSITGCTTEKNVWVGGVRDYAGGICGTNAGGTLSGNTYAAICGSGSDAVLPETASQQ